MAAIWRVVNQGLVEGRKKLHKYRAKEVQAKEETAVQLARYSEHCNGES